MSASRLLLVAAKAIYVIAITRNFDPHLYGLISYSISWYLAFLPITLLGLGMILAREIGRDRSQAADIIPHTLAIRAFSALLISVLCGGIGLIVEPDPLVRSMLLLSAIALVGRAVTLWTEHVYVAFEALQFRLLQDVIYRPLEVVCGIAVLYAGGGAVEILAIHAISWVLQAAHGLWIVSSRFNELIAPLEWNRVCNLLKTGIVYGVGVAAIGWLSAGPLVLFRQFETSSDSLGQVALALQLFTILNIVPMSVAGVALPVLTRSAARGDRKDNLYVEGFSRLVALVGVLGAVVGFALGPWITELLFGTAYELTGDLLGWVALLLIPFSAAQSMGQVLVARAQVAAFLFSACAGAAALTVVLLLIVPQMGAIGVILAAGLGMALQCLIAGVFLARKTGINLKRSIYFPWTVTVTTVAVYMGLRQFGITIAAAGSFIALLVGVWTFGIISREERKLFAKLLLS